LRDDNLVRFTLADLLGRLGRGTEAEAEYLAVTKAQDNADARMALGRLYDGLGRLEEAVAQYRRAADLYTAARQAVADSARVAVASALARLCRAPEGVAALAPSVTPLGQASLEALMEMAILYEEVGRTADASSVYGQLKTAGADSPLVHFLAGGFAYRQGRMDEAVQEMETAVRLAPAFSLARGALGSYYAEQGRSADADAAFEGALAVMPSNALAFTGKALLAMERGDLGGAAALLEQAARVQPEYVKAVWDETGAAMLTIRLYQGMVREMQGDAAGARADYSGALELARQTAARLPTHPVANFQLGAALWLTGDTSAADAAFASASRCDATLSGETARTLARLTRLLKR
jgi:Flp pilus assembly protein TadD